MLSFSEFFHQNCRILGRRWPFRFSTTKQKTRKTLQKKASKAKAKIYRYIYCYTKGFETYAGGQRKHFEVKKYQWIPRPG
jgi:hypothetical protein